MPDGAPAYSLSPLWTLHHIKVRSALFRQVGTRPDKNSGNKADRTMFRSVIAKTLDYQEAGVWPKQCPFSVEMCIYPAFLYQLVNLIVCAVPSSWLCACIPCCSIFQSGIQRGGEVAWKSSRHLNLSISPALQKLTRMAVCCRLVRSWPWADRNCQSAKTLYRTAKHSGRSVLSIVMSCWKSTFPLSLWPLGQTSCRYLRTDRDFQQSRFSTSTQRRSNLDSHPPG